MIDKRELRIGNKVGSPKHDLSVATIQGMATNNIVMLEEVKTYDLFSEIEPIPLSDEWLRKFGFDTMDYEYASIDWAIEDTELQFSLTQSGIPVEQQPFVLQFDTGMGDREIIIQHVHQLQNLYFALTGEELTIKATS